MLTHGTRASTALSRLTRWLSVLLTGLSLTIALGQADNDAFAHAVRLHDLPAALQPHLLNATLEPGEPDQEILRGGTVWYQWEPSDNGLLRISGDFAGSSLVVFEGGSLSELKPQSPEASGAGITYEVRAATAYAIAIGGPSPFQGATEPAVSVTVEFRKLPPNDRFASRLALEGDTVDFTAWLTGATLDPGEPSLDPNRNLPTVWWHWTAPASGRVTLEVLSGFAWVGAFTGSTVSSLNLQAMMSHPQVPVSFEASAGTDYAIGVTGWIADPHQIRLSLARWMVAAGEPTSRTVPHPYSLTFSIAGIPGSDIVTNLFVYDVGDLGVVLDTNQLAGVNIPALVAGTHEIQGQALCSNGHRYALTPLRIQVVHPNDDFNTRPMLHGSPVEFVADTRGATLDPGELEAVAGSVWWSWQAPQSGLVLFTLISGANVGLRLCEGTSPTTLTTVADNLVVAGRTYVLRAGPWVPEPGRYRLEIIERPTPHDAFAGRRPLDTQNVWQWADFGAASAEPGEPGDGAGNTVGSLWYSFTPPADGIIKFGGSPHREFVVPYLYPGSVYTGDTLESLEPVPTQDGSTRYRVQAGRSYALRLQRAFNDTATLASIYFHFVPMPSNDAFASPTPLTGDRIGFAAGLDGSTAEAGEPGMGALGSSPVRSRWWTWTAPRSGWASWQVARPTPSAEFWPFQIEVFEGTSLESLTPVPLTRLQWECRFFRAESSRQYVLRISDLGGEGGIGTNSIPFRLDLSDVELATPIPTEPIQLPEGPVFTVRGPSADSPGTRVVYREIVGTAGGGIWQDLVMTADLGEGATPGGRFTTDSLPPGSHTCFAVLYGEDGSMLATPPVTFSVRPANDDLDQAQLLQGHHAKVNGSVAGATRQPGEPALGLATANVWYQWIAPANGPVTIRATGANYVRAYTGETSATLQAVNAGAALAATETFTASRGTTYRFAAASLDGQTGNLSFQLDQNTLQWTSPATNAIFKLGEPITFGLSTTELEEDVARTVFKAGGNLLLDAPPPPYTFTWTNAEPGSYSLTSQLLLRSGEILTNTTRRIRVFIPNTNALTALPIEGRSGNLAVDLRGSDRDSDGSTASAWFRWQAPGNGHLLIRTTANNTTTSKAQFSVGLPPQPLTVIKTNGSLSLQGYSTIPVTNGVTYNIRIAGTPGLLMPALTYEFLERPPHDDFAQALVLQGIALTNRAITLPATAEPGEPAHGSKPAARSVWYQWTAPARGLLTLGHIASGAIYTGDSLTTLTRITGTAGSSLSAMVEPEVTYRIAIDDSTSGRPDVNWDLFFTPSPPNDAFANRVPLAGRRLRFTAALSLATGENDDPKPEGYNYGRTVWYEWTPPARGLASLHTSPAARITVLRGDSLPALDMITYNVWDVSFQADAGARYVIMLDANGGGPSATTVDLVLDQPAGNDNYDGAVRFAGHAAHAEGWTIGAHREYLEPHHAGTPGGRSVWYRWQAPASGPTQVTVSGDIPATLLAVYSGAVFHNLQPVASHAGGSHSSVMFDAIQGMDYAIAVDGAAGAAGDFVLDLRLEAVAPPPTLTLAMDPAQGIRIRVAGLAGKAAQIEASSDLNRWEPWILLPGGTQETEVVDGVPGTLRFYRVRREP